MCCRAVQRARRWWPRLDPWTLASDPRTVNERPPDNTASTGPSRTGETPGRSHRPERAGRIRITPTSSTPPSRWTSDVPDHCPTGDQPVGAVERRAPVRDWVRQHVSRRAVTRTDAPGGGSSRQWSYPHGLSRGHRPRRVGGPTPHPTTRALRRVETTSPSLERWFGPHDQQFLEAEGTPLSAGPSDRAERSDIDLPAATRTSAIRSTAETTAVGTNGTSPTPTPTPVRSRALLGRPIAWSRRATRWRRRVQLTLAAAITPDATGGPTDCRSVRARSAPPCLEDLSGEQSGRPVPASRLAPDPSFCRAGRRRQRWCACFCKRPEYGASRMCLRRWIRSLSGARSDLNPRVGRSSPAGWCNEASV